MCYRNRCWLHRKCSLSFSTAIPSELRQETITPSSVPPKTSIRKSNGETRFKKLQRWLFDQPEKHKTFSYRLLHVRPLFTVLCRYKDDVQLDTAKTNLPIEFPSDHVLYVRKATASVGGVYKCEVVLHNKRSEMKIFVKVLDEMKNRCNISE